MGFAAMLRAFLLALGLANVVNPFPHEDPCPSFFNRLHQHAVGELSDRRLPFEHADEPDQ